ncbi:MAG TPA: acyl carrier protein [Candidatus Sulfomarinibacteraceae bacterium]|nr:acyl carrier protein [Candidatus Sulfomarinibacteraceae bacterium]
MNNGRGVIFEQIQGMLGEILAHKNLNGATFPLNASLYEQGVGLDSLDTAAFSAMLEATFGADPYSAGVFPETIEDVVRFYEGARPS